MNSPLLRLSALFMNQHSQWSQLSRPVSSAKDMLTSVCMCCTGCTEYTTVVLLFLLHVIGSSVSNTAVTRECIEVLPMSRWTRASLIGRWCWEACPNEPWPAVAGSHDTTSPLTRRARKMDLNVGFMTHGRGWFSETWNRLLTTYLAGNSTVTFWRASQVSSGNSPGSQPGSLARQFSRSSSGWNTIYKPSHSPADFHLVEWDLSGNQFTMEWLCWIHGS